MLPGSFVCMKKKRLTLSSWFGAALLKRVVRAKQNSKDVGCKTKTISYSGL